MYSFRTAAGETAGKGIGITVGRMGVFNYALYQNHVSPVREIYITNETGVPAEGLALHITSDVHFFAEQTTPLPAVPSGKPVAISDPALMIDGKMLAGLTEEIVTVVTVELLKDGESICGCQEEMRVLAYDQWQGGSTYQSFLASFVLPNHPVIAMLLHDASERLAIWKLSSALDGYQKKDPNRVRQLAAAAYAAIQKKNIVYAEPPASFTAAGQRIRTPETVMEQRLGTCMDLTLLYAACLEALGLHPLLVMMDGHIFAGLWLRERSQEELKAGSIVLDSVRELRMRYNNSSDELTFVECTSFCAGKEVDFEDSERMAKQMLAEADMFRFAVDVACARSSGIRPLAFRIRNNGEYVIPEQEKAEEHITSAPAKLDITAADVSAVMPKKATGKRELWESRLLDLTLRNMLLNLSRRSSIVPILSCHVDELEDALADGQEFQIMAVPEWLTTRNVVKTNEDGSTEETSWLEDIQAKGNVFELYRWPAGEDFDLNEKIRQEYRNHRLYTFNTPKQMEKDLTKIYRAARTSQLENGVSSLYLAVGLMKWYPEEESAPCYAPLILLPAEMVRKPAAQGYALHLREEEAHFNSTLLEMLRQNFSLEIGGLEPLPTDEHGIDIRRVFNLVRSRLFSFKNWDVEETCVIGNFSFAQFAIWNDIHTAGDLLESSRIVRSLLKGRIDWENELPEEEEEDFPLPVAADETQLEAIRTAVRGTTFVLHGPPGTGKSQTITGMISSLLARGKRVLFVAEKMAALSVVQRRLTSLGIGDFCLELHSDKANKKHVLEQLSRALEAKAPAEQPEYEDALRSLGLSRSQLDEYVNHLHTPRKCGLSLRGMIDRYEKVRGQEKAVIFSSGAAEAFTEKDLRSHLPLIARLTAAGGVMGGMADNPLAGVHLDSYSAEVRGAVREETERYRTLLESAKRSAVSAAQLLGQNTPRKKKDYLALDSTAKLFSEASAAPEVYRAVLKSSQETLFSYYNREKAVRAEEEELLKTWKKEFLNLDMAWFLEKHEKAEKKLFGKKGAMDAVTAELEQYSIRPLSFQEIPGLLQAVTACRRNREQLQSVFDQLPENEKSVVRQLADGDSFHKARAAAATLRKREEKFPGGPDMIRLLADDASATAIFKEFLESFHALTGTEQRLNDLLKRTPSADSGNWIEEERNFCSALLQNQGALKDLGLYNQVRQECMLAGLQPAVEAYEGGMDAEQLQDAYRKGVYTALISETISRDDVLSSFSGASFEEAVRQFKIMDDAVMQKTRTEILRKLVSRIPTPWTSPEAGLELTLLRKAIGSTARGMSIRKLFDRIPHILPALCPCMLMSPNSVAQYLAQQNDLFDIVIFDEASQLPTCKAAGTLYRAKDAVIVGDPKQMPPTSFFSGSGPEVEDLQLDDLDSILEDALALGVPSLYLKWHYRSSHESLIAFSNRHFYENRMLTFPSANDRERRVKTVRVDGVYRNGTNPKEAEAVVQEILRRYLDPELRSQSVGVVTFNVKQQALIENLLMRQYQRDPALDEWANSGEDPLFVKNLENVQGDERDAILFSITYGPDERGRISMNFGPINQEGGSKRLNVAFSRSRISMTVFASMGPEDMKVTDTSPEGVVAFRDFLSYADGGSLGGSAGKKAGAEEDDGILQSVRSFIEESGYRCETMVGHSDFRLDIAVIDPYEPEEYMLGVLLDGDSYRRTANTRDREVSQAGVLKNLGWSLYRIWTVDWWDNRERELRRLLRELEKQKELSQKRAEERKAKLEREKEEAEAREAEARRRNEELKSELDAAEAEVIAEAESGMYNESSI
ncbi:MAG: DUF4011 domain-containing protein [Stomatobaculum sp.]|nr:DUF4011 domain-containing protein [Stomatobaculum sp.]